MTQTLDATDEWLADAERAHSLAAEREAGINRYAKQQRWTDKRRAFLAGVKLAAGCADCGYAEHHSALHFDHLPGTDKRFNISEGVAYAWERLASEMAKCEVVCANCHAVRTSARHAERKAS